MISPSEARARIAAKTPRLEAEEVSLAEAVARVTRVDIAAPEPLPAWDNSAMDGYAVRAAELPSTLPVSGTIAAGDPPGAVLAPSTTWRIMTGAPVPAGADTVVMREDVGEGEHEAVFNKEPRLGSHIRRKGEDVASGSTVIAAGSVLGSGELGLLAALNIPSVTVGQRPRVALLSTGTELVPLGTAVGPGQKINSNAVALSVEIAAAGARVTSDAIALDDPASMRVAFEAALDQCDVLLTSGGVSAGDFDFARDVAADAGITIDFWKIAIKPGKPLVFGTTNRGQLYFGLPGNPVSTMVTFELFVRPALLAMSGASVVDRPRAPVQLAATYKKQRGRAHYLRASLVRTGEHLLADVARKQGSGMLTSMVGVDALIEVPADVEEVPAGEPLSALLLEPR